MKLFNLSIPLFVLALLATPVIADPPADTKRGKKGAAADRADAPRRIDGPRRGGEGDRPDATQMAKRMMDQFDKDGDQKLDSTELVAALTFVQERMSGRRGARPAARDGEARRRGQRQAGADKAPGGDRPKRPQAE